MYKFIHAKNIRNMNSFSMIFHHLLIKFTFLFLESDKLWLEPIVSLRSE